MKKDLKKTKALLRDAQTLVEKNQNDGTNKVILRQLKNQVPRFFVLFLLAHFYNFFAVVNPFILNTEQL